MRVYAYTRVSTKEQDTALQREAILDYASYRKFDVVRIFSDKLSGKDTDRPDYLAMISSLEDNPLGIQAIVTYKMDRLGRSLSDLIDLIKFLDAHHIQLICITENIDMTTIQGRLQIHLISCLAEYERALINERTSAGMERAKRNGVKFGRKKIILPMKEVEALLVVGVPYTKVAQKYKVSLSTLYKNLRKYRADRAAGELAALTEQP